MNKIALKYNSNEYKRTMNNYINMHKQETVDTFRKLRTKTPKSTENKSQKKRETTPSITDFSNHFKNINKKHEEEGISLHNDTMDSQNVNMDETNLNTVITEEEILQSIQNLNNSKSPGKTDHILINIYIRSTNHKLLPIYKFLFNAIMDTGHMPEIWPCGAINPIYKGKGNPSNPNNYRPIHYITILFR